MSIYHIMVCEIFFFFFLHFYWLFHDLQKKKKRMLTYLVANASTASMVKLQDAKRVCSLGVQSWMGHRLSMSGCH